MIAIIAMSITFSWLIIGFITYHIYASTIFENKSVDIPKFVQSLMMIFWPILLCEICFIKIIEIITYIFKRIGIFLNIIDAPESSR